MRTDAVSLSQEAVAEIRELIESQYGPSYLPESPRVFKTKAKNAQEAHEAIRPTSVRRLPDDVKSYLSPDQVKLYTLIWKRAVACQMASAKIDTVMAEMATEGADWLLRANGSTVAFPGFLALYQEGLDDGKQDDDKALPPLEKGQALPLKDIEALQHFTEPPPRYSEATLVKTLESFGIGRPSTYASIIDTLVKRDYTELLQKKFYPTDLGRVVNKFLVEHFTRYVDYGFTAQLEDDLDAVSRGELAWKPLLRQFWDPFHSQVEDKAKSVSRADVVSEKLDEACPKCGEPLAIKLGRGGRFIACTGYPECTYSRPLGEDGQSEPETVGRDCPECGEPLQYRFGRYGKFIGCSAYPKCKYKEPLEKPKSTGITCPECNKGELLGKKSRYGKLFYGCSNYPECQYAVWDPPIEEPCPKCGGKIMTLKTTKRWGEEKVCPDRACGFRCPVDATEEEIAAIVQRLIENPPVVKPPREKATKKKEPAKTKTTAKSTAKKAASKTTTAKTTAKTTKKKATTAGKATKKADDKTTSENTSKKATKAKTTKKTAKETKSSETVSA